MWNSEMPTSAFWMLGSKACTPCPALFVFWDRVFLCNPGCPRTHSVIQAGLELTDLPASASGVLVIWIQGVCHHFPRLNSDPAASTSWMLDSVLGYVVLESFVHASLPSYIPRFTFLIFKNLFNLWASGSLFCKMCQAWWHIALNPALRMQRQRGYSEFKASLLYIESSQWNPVPKHTL